MRLELGPSGRAWQFDVSYVEGHLRGDESPWRGWGIRYRPHHEHRLRVIFMDGLEARPPDDALVLLAIEQHYDDEQAGRVRR